MILTKAARLHDALVGLNVLTVRQIGNNFEIVYNSEATQQDIISGNAILAAFDTSDSAEITRLELDNPEKQALKQSAMQALNENTIYLNNLSPINSQVVAQVRSLTQQNNVIIKRLLQISEKDQVLVSNQSQPTPLV